MKYQITDLNNNVYTNSPDLDGKTDEQVCSIVGVWGAIRCHDRSGRVTILRTSQIVHVKVIADKE